MKRTTVKLPDEVDALLRFEAERRGVTVSELTREAIETHLGYERPRRKLSIVGIGESGEPNLAERAEEILRQEWGGSPS